ncbi:MAG: hypothetical protein V2I27_00230 [Erythrobacter sp.]|nr:hypothetical protein [Erythrobacter sp.]
MDYLPLSEAADRLSKERRYTIAKARKVLIASFMDELAFPVCREWWGMVTCDYQSFALPSRNDVPVPRDFWRMEHAKSFHHPDGYLPTGSWGRWRKVCDFDKAICLTGDTAIYRYPELFDFVGHRTSPVTIETKAIDVRLFPTDLERICKDRQHKALLRRIERRPSVPAGNLTKSDSEKIWASMIVYGLEAGDRLDIASDRRRVLEFVQEIASNESVEALISERVMRRMADRIVEAANERIVSRGPPTS